MAGVDHQRFLTDLYVADAVSLQVAVAGEAARRLSDQFKASHPTIPWRRIIALRNIIAHDYGAIQPARLWDVAIRTAPDLLAALPDPPPLADDVEN